MVVVTSKGCFLDVFLPHLDLMIARTKVNLGEVDGPMQFVHQLINPWYWVSVFDGLFIQGPEASS
jgi:hypothetical protein